MRYNVSQLLKSPTGTVRHYKLHEDMLDKGKTRRRRFTVFRVIFIKIVLLGAPGVGKGTIAELIMQRYGILHISTGEILRKEIRKGTAIGKKVKSFIEKGNLAPDEIIIEITKKKGARERL